MTNADRFLLKQSTSTSTSKIFILSGIITYDSAERTVGKNTVYSGKRM